MTQPGQVYGLGPITPGAAACPTCGAPLAQKDQGVVCSAAGQGCDFQAVWVQIYTVPDPRLPVFNIYVWRHPLHGHKMCANPMPGTGFTSRSAEWKDIVENLLLPLALGWSRRSLANGWLTPEQAIELTRVLIWGDGRDILREKWELEHQL